MKKNAPKKPKINNITIVSAAIVTVTVLVGAVFIYMPYKQKTEILVDQILRERDKNVLVAKIKALNDHLKVYKKRIPEGRGVSWLLAEVSDMAAKENIDITSVKPGSPEDRGLYTRLYVTMDIVSNYGQLGRFMARIESSEKFIRVESVKTERIDLGRDFNPEDAKYNRYDLKTSVAISTLVLKD